MTTRQRPVRLGLTGGIGSGKSTVGQMLVAMGAVLIDADQIAREVTGPGGAAMAAIRSAFGAAFIDTSGGLDRVRMRELAFSQPSARSQLESIIHPLVSLRSREQAHYAAAQGCRVIVHDVPLLAESGHWADRLDAVVVVDCDEKTQIDRVTRRSGLSVEAIQSIIRSQASRRARSAVADIVIANEAHCTLEQLRGEVVQVAALFGL